MTSYNPQLAANQSIADLASSPQPHALHISESGFEQLRAANVVNRVRFAAQYSRVVDMLRNAAQALMQNLADKLDSAVLVSDTLLDGILLDELPYYSAALYLVMRADSVTDDDYDLISDTALVGLDASLLRLQVYMLSTDEWRQLAQKAALIGPLEKRAATLLSRE
jgi:hypothetical protein